MISMPVNLTRIMKNSMELFGCKPRKQTKLSPAYVIQQTKELM